MSVTSGQGNTDIQRVKEFFTLYGSGKTWEEAETEFSNFYDKDVVYETGTDDEPNFGYEKLIAMGKQNFDGTFRFTLDKIEARDDGIYTSGWVNKPGVTNTTSGGGDGDGGDNSNKGRYVQSVSQLKDGKFICIKRVGTKVEA